MFIPKDNIRCQLLKLKWVGQLIERNSDLKEAFVITVNASKNGDENREASVRLANQCESKVIYGQGVEVLTENWVRKNARQQWIKTTADLQVVIENMQWLGEIVDLSHNSKIYGFSVTVTPTRDPAQRRVKAALWLKKTQRAVSYYESNVPTQVSRYSGWVIEVAKYLWIWRDKKSS